MSIRRFRELRTVWCMRNEGIDRLIFNFPRSLRTGAYGFPSRRYRRYKLYMPPCELAGEHLVGANVPVTNLLQSDCSEHTTLTAEHIHWSYARTPLRFHHVFNNVLTIAGPTRFT